MNRSIVNNAKNNQGLSKQDKRWNRIVTAALFPLVTLALITALTIYVQSSSNGGGMHAFALAIFVVPLLLVNFVIAVVNIITVIVYLKNDGQTRLRSVFAVVSLCISLAVTGFMLMQLPVA